MPLPFATSTPALTAAARALGRGIGALARGVGWAAGRPAVLGAAYLLALTAAAESAPLVSETERVLGDDSSEVTAWVALRFAGVIREMEWSLGLSAIAVGAALGLASGALLRLRAAALGRQRPPRLHLLPASLALTALLHACFWARSVAVTPQLYAADLYARGGLRRAVQLALTDGLGPGGATLLFLIPALVLAPPWRWPVLASAAARVLRPWPRAAVAGGAMAVALLAAFLPSPVAARRRPARPNVLVIGADSFRHEALSPRVMPRLSALAEHGTRFSRAYVPLARTFSSWVTLLTGQYPHHHGVRSMLARWEDRHREIDTLPARFRRAGYDTAVVSDYGGDVFSAMDFGFSRVDVPHASFPEEIRVTGWSRATPLLPFVHGRLGRRLFPTLREMRPAADAGMLADDAIRALRGFGDAPFFLTVFFSAPHFPYAAPAPYYRRFTDPAYRGRYKYLKPAWLEAGEAPDAGDVAQIRGLYEGALASVDEAAGRVLDELERRGQAEHTIVVVLGDHGENLLDAGRWHGHGNHLFGDHDLRIPLVIVDPRRAGRAVVDGVALGVDLAPTLYELAGVEPPRDLDGASLAPALAGAPLSPRPIFAETELWIGVVKELPADQRFPYPSVIRYAEVDGAHGDELVLKRSMQGRTTAARHRAVIDGEYKLIYVPTEAGVRWLLFDTAADPEDLHDVAASHPGELARLQELLWPWMLQDPAMERRHGFLAPRGERLPEIDGP